MSKHSNLEYSKKPLSPKVMARGIALLVVGVVLILIGIGSSSIYHSPIKNFEKHELTHRKAVLASKFGVSLDEKGYLLSKPKYTHDDHGKDKAHGEKHGKHAAHDHGGHAHKEPTKSTRLWTNILVAFLFITSVGAGSLFLIGLEHVVGARWSSPLRRVVELMAFVLFAALILGLVIVGGGMETLFYEWLHPGDDKILLGKQAYLSLNGFIIRFAICFGFMLLFYFFFTKNSNAQDTNPDQKYTRLSGKFSPVFIIGFSLVISIIAIDFIMTLSPHWFSTMFGVSYFSGTVVAGLAASILASVLLKENGYLHPKMKNDTFYSIGGLLFGFNCFWAYISFCQFMLIWYSNLPEETFWFLARWEGNWFYYTLFVIGFHFVIPFMMLISRSSKTNLSRLKMMSVWLLIAHYVDLYWHVVPSFSDSPFIGLLEVGFLLASFGLVVVLFAIKAKNANHVAVGDPKLEQGLNFRLH